RLESIAYSAKEGFPARKLKCIGVTGTNGKTTTTNLIFTMMKEAGYKVAVLSSTQYGYLDDLHDEDEHMSTVPVPLLQKRLKRFVEQGAEWLVIESTSHALAQHRVWGLDMQIGIMTNVTHEHLDYHGTFERYKQDKRKLFQLVAKNKNGLGIAYAEDPAAEEFLHTTPRRVSYGFEKADVLATTVNLAVDHSQFTVKAGPDTYRLTMHMPGAFNVLNAMAAVAVGRELGLTKEQIEHGIAALTGVPCRMMPVDEGQAFRVIIDYAGTPDAFEKVFSALRPTVKGKLVCVYGSPAHRDVMKRPIQGEISAKYCDEVILTEEENRDEPGMQILEDMAKGAEKGGKVREKNLFLIENRTDAIEFAMTRVSSKDDVVITLGKGHEKTIERGHDIFPWDEPATVRDAIRNVLSKKK
nr:UDP-N-acetylmuramyl-tripeptide synthetase [Candidatus Saccharibacteria bacterium]